MSIGRSGWVYRHWRGRFYPKEVELNNSFYRQPSLEQFERRRSAVPDDFAYAVKLIASSRTSSA